MPQKQKIEVVQAFEPSRRHIRAGDVFIYRMSNGLDYYGLVAKHKFDLGGFKNCLLLYFFNATAQDVAINELSVRKHGLLFAPTLGGSECWREGYFSTLRRVELTGEMVYPNHYFKYPQGIADENLNRVGEPDPSIPIGYAAYPVGLTLLDYIEDSLN